MLILIERNGGWVMEQWVDVGEGRMNGWVLVRMEQWMDVGEDEMDEWMLVRME